MISKKGIIVLILKLLENETDKNHPLTQVKIAEIINDVYSCDRKTVGRNIGFLQSIGYPIVKTPNGFYLDKRLFSIEEIEFIFNAISHSDGKSDDEKNKIIEKLMSALMILIR